MRKQQQTTTTRLTRTCTCALEMCLVLTDDTRLARPEQLEEVEGVCRRWTCDGSVTQEQTHYSIGTSYNWRSRDANGTCSALRAFLLEATLTMASAPQRVTARMCVDMSQKLARPRRKSDRVWHQDRASIQMTLHIANRVPIPTYRKSTFRIPMISSLCSAPHDKKDTDVERSPSEILFMVHSSQTATSTEVETWLLLSFTRACFLTTLTFRALRGNHTVMVTLAVFTRACFEPL